MKNIDPATILLAEDDDGHAFLLQKRLEAAGLFNPIVRFRNGVEAWDYISGKTAPCLEPERNYLLVLDIRMPGMDGIEVLKLVKAEPSLKHIPVIMLTTTDDPKDEARCRSLGCCRHLAKPEGFDKIADDVKHQSLPYHEG